MSKIVAIPAVPFIGLEIIEVEGYLEYSTNSHALLLDVSWQARL